MNLTEEQKQELKKLAVENFDCWRDSDGISWKKKLEIRPEGNQLYISGRIILVAEDQEDQEYGYSTKGSLYYGTRGTRYYHLHLNFNADSLSVQESIQAGFLKLYSDEYWDLNDNEIVKEDGLSRRESGTITGDFDIAFPNFDTGYEDLYETLYSVLRKIMEILDI